ncbi:MAG: sulfurtransferase [Usitatibacter sp.]
MTQLVTTEELAKHIGDPQWVVLDLRHDLADANKGRNAYEAGHIPGAYFIGLDKDLSGPKTGKTGRHPLPAPETFAATMNGFGITPDTHVVIYDDTSGSYAGRLFWMLRWIGHDKVALLDGGIPKWIKEGRALSKDVTAERAGSVIARPTLGATVDVHFVDRFKESGDITLIDARAPNRFAGEGETLDPVGGHIPGAVNRFWQKNLNADGTFKSSEMLRAEFAELLGGADPSKVVHSCGSGVTACHNAFAMELAGLPTGRLYPGSWSEWCADPARAVAK